MRETNKFMNRVMALALSVVLFGTGSVTADARTSSALNSNDVGVGSLLNPTEVAEISDEEVAKAHTIAADINDQARGGAIEDEQQEETEDSSKLVMANVSQVMNIRITPDDDAEKVGVLYKDCGGKIIEQKDGWTKLQSGDVVGWAKDEYLLFDDEAEELASEVGVQLASSNVDALRIRAEADEDAEVIGVIAKNGFLDMIEDLGNGWISVDYNDETGYVQAEFVDTDFRIDEGETMAAIEEREAAEAKRKAEEAAKKAKLTQNTGAVAAGADEARLLAALIYCEAGNQSYEGKVAVGAVVMNRVKSSAYAGTISGVIYASGQFTPALNGSVDRVYNGNIPDSCIQAAQAALAGETTCGTALHFRRAGGHDGQVIGAHVFW